MHVIADLNRTGAEPKQFRRLTPKQAAEASKVHVSTVYRSIKRGTLTAYRRGRFILLDAEDVSAAFQNATHADRVDAYVNRIVAQAPPLTPDQVARFGTLLRTDPVEASKPTS